MEIDQTYRGREHSYVKHELLKSYLEVLLNIVGAAGTKEIVYVDCFAGPWGDETDTLSGTSIAISLNILEKVRETLITKFGKSGVHFKAIYVEENKRSFSKLQDYLAENCPEGIDCHSLNGDYWKLQDEILRLCGNRAFAFFFIDPLGWLDVGVPKLKKLLTRPKSEFLINFMYDFLNRAIGMADFRDQVSQMLGRLTETDFAVLQDMTGQERADWVVRRYREQLKKEMGDGGRFLPRSFHADVLHREKERVHYHLVYLTRHHKGIIKFAEVSEKVSFIQKVLRIQTKMEKSGQMNIFSAEEQASLEEQGQTNLEDVKKYWLDILALEQRRYGEIQLATMLEGTGWLIDDFQAAFKALSDEGKAENLDGSTRRTKHFIHFDKNERLRRCV